MSEKKLDFQPIGDNVYALNTAQGLLVLIPKLDENLGESKSGKSDIVAHTVGMTRPVTDDPRLMLSITLSRQRAVPAKKTGGREPITIDLG